MRWSVVLRGQETNREYVYRVASLHPLTTERVLFGAIAEHGRVLLAGAVAECVHPTGEVTEVTSTR